MAWRGEDKIAAPTPEPYLIFLRNMQNKLNFEANYIGFKWKWKNVFFVKIFALVFV